MKPLELDSFLGYKFLSDVRWAPDGKRAAFVVSECDAKANDYKAYLYLYEGGSVRRLSGAGKESSFFWEDATHILFPADRSEDEKKRHEDGEQFTAYYRLAVDGGEAEKAFELPLGCGELHAAGDKKWFTAPIDADCPDAYALTKEEKAERLKAKKDDADYIVLEDHPFWFNGSTHRSRRRIALFLLEGDRITRVSGAETDVHGAEYLDGKLYFLAEEYAHRSTFRSALYAYDMADGTTECLVPADGAYLRGIDAFGKDLLVLGTDGAVYGMEEASDFCLYHPDTKKWSKLAENEKSLENSTGSDCRYGGGYDQRMCGDRFLYLATEGGAAHLMALNADGTSEGLYMGEGAVDCFDANDAGEILAVAMLNGKLQELYAIADGKAVQLTHFNDAVTDEYYVADYEKLTVKSDIDDIDGWVLKPFGYDPEKKYPAVLDIHGGPRTAYGEVFYHEMQYWAGQGYFVFFCNPTGSDGRGDRFADIWGKYGEQDYRDIMAFTDAVLAKYPQIDVKRVAVTGGSYGGFMTNWIIGHTDRFACAATQRSISNWTSFYGTSDIGIRFGEFQMRADIFSSPEKMWKQSPIAYADNFKTPTLIIHSECDYRCPISEGYTLFTALQEKNVPVRMVVFKGENHELSRGGKPQHRVRRLREISEWIAKYTKE